MPPPLDLMGRVFGQLTVICRDGRMKFGREQTAWLCRCSCGATLRVPQNRLPHRSSIPAGQIITACDDCRSHPCVICGAPIPARASAKTCSAECAAERRRQNWRAYYHRYALDPEYRAAHTQAVKDRFAALTPEQRSEIYRRQARRREEMQGREEINRAAREHYAARMTDPEKAAAHRARRDKWAAENPDRIRRIYRKHAEKKRAIKAAQDLAAVSDAMRDRYDE